MFLKPFHFTLLITSLALSLCTSASENSSKLSDRFTLSGFGTLGVVKSGDEDLGFRRNFSTGNNPVFDGDWSAKQDSLLGLQLNTIISNDLEFTVQLVARDRLDNSLQQSIEWAFLSYDISPEITARAGRMGVDLFMLSEYRNIGITYLWARPPTEFYGLIGFENFDGVDIKYITPAFDGYMHLKAFGGVSKDNLVDSDDRGLDLNPFYGINLVWENNTWQARINYSRAHIDYIGFDSQTLQDTLNYASTTGWTEASSIADGLVLSDTKSNYYSAGIAYDDTPWQIQAELSYVESDAWFFLPIMSSYLSVARQFDPFTLYSIVAISKITKDKTINSAPAEWTEVQDALESILESNRLEQTSLSIGSRWDIRYDIAIKLQWDHHWVEHPGSLWHYKEGGIKDKEIDTFSINLDFTF